MLSKIKSANIVWYSKITGEGNAEFLKIPQSIIYPNLIKTSFYLAFRDKYIDFMDDAYENKSTFEKFSKLLNGALFIEGKLQKENNDFRILVQKKYELDNSHLSLKVNKLAPYLSFLCKKGLHNTNDFIAQLNNEKDSFQMISICQNCNIPEDESDFVWVAYENNEWWVRLWIHNNGNMWTAHFVL